MSAENDPYSMEKYPLKYQIVIGKQAHNARQLVKAAQAKGAYLNMYRQPLTRAQIMRLKELVPHELARRNGEFYPGEDNEIRNVLDHLGRRWLRSVDREARAQARLSALKMQINAAPRETSWRINAGYQRQLRRAASALALKVQARGREVDAAHRELLSAASELTRR